MMDYLLEPQVNLLFQNNFQLRLDRIFQLKHVSVYVEEEIVLPQFQSCICLLCDKHFAFLFFRQVIIPLFYRSEPINILQKHVVEPLKLWIVTGGKWR